MYQSFVSDLVSVAPFSFSRITKLSVRTSARIGEVMAEITRNIIGGNILGSVASWNVINLNCTKILSQLSILPEPSNELISTYSVHFLQS